MDTIRVYRKFDQFPEFIKSFVEEHEGRDYGASRAEERRMKRTKIKEQWEYGRNDSYLKQNASKWKSKPSREDAHKVEPKATKEARHAVCFQYMSA